MKKDTSIRSYSPSSGKSLRFYNMGMKPLAYPVKCGRATVIPEGATGVKIAFGQSHLTYKDPDTGKIKHMNVYLYNGRIYHA